MYLGWRLHLRLKVGWLESERLRLYLEQIEMLEYGVGRVSIGAIASGRSCGTGGTGTTGAAGTTGAVKE